MENISSFLEYGGMGLAALIFLGYLYESKNREASQAKTVESIMVNFREVSKEYSTTLNNHLEHMRETIDNNNKTTSLIKDVVERNSRIMERVETKLDKI